MRLVQQANQRPFRCAIIPFKGNSNSSGFVDTGQFLGEDKVYASFEGCVLLAKAIGWTGPSQKRGLEQENAGLKAENDQLKAELAEAEKTLGAIDFLGSKDFVKRNKPGRKPRSEQPKETVN